MFSGVQIFLILMVEHNSSLNLDLVNCIVSFWTSPKN